MCRKVYILGAGASIEFLKNEKGESLSTQALTAILCSKEAWKETFDEIKRIGGSLSNKIQMRDIDFNLDDFFFLIEDFVKDFDEIYSNSKRICPEFLDFEKMIDYIDNVIFILRNRKRENISHYHPCIHLEKYFTKVAKRLNDLASRKEMRMIPILAREVLHYYINSCKVEEGSVELFRNYFLSEIDRYSHISIVTLNYDTLLWEALKETDYFFGFNDNRFDKKEYFSKRYTISHLHGHQFFYPSPNNINMEQSGRDVFTKRVISFWTHDHCAITQKCQSVSFITGYQKEKNLQVAIYNSFYNKFVHDMLEANEICCIGYGCRDHHVNSPLRLRMEDVDNTFVDYVKEEDEKNDSDFFMPMLERGGLTITNKTKRLVCGTKKFLKSNVN